MDGNVASVENRPRMKSLDIYKRYFSQLKSVVFLALLTISTSSNAAYWLGLSQGGKHDATSVSLGIRGDKWGGNMSAIFNSDYSTSDVLDYDTPHNNYIIVKKGAHIGNSIGFDLTRYFNFRENHSLYLGAGAYFSKQCDVARSNSTNWLYCHDKKTNIDSAISTGYMVKINELSLGVGYHSERGLDLMIGSKF